jgi:integrase
VIYIEETGPKTYVARVSVPRRLTGGKPFKKRSKSFSSKTKAQNLKDAQKWANDTEKAAKDGKPAPTAAKGYTINQAFEAYLDQFTPDDKEIGRYIQIMQPRLPDVGHFKVQDFTNGEFSAYIERMRKEKVPDRRKPENRTGPDDNRHYLYDGKTVKLYTDSTIRKYIYTLKKVLTWHAEQHNYRIPFNFQEKETSPTKINIPAAWHKRERRLDADLKEEKRLLDACALQEKNPETWRLLILFALETAMRAQELVLCCWSHIGNNGKNLYLPAKITKADLDRTIGLSNTAREILKIQGETKNKDDDRIFWQFNNSVELTKGFRQLCHRAGINNLRLHDLRHEAIARLVLYSNWSIPELMKMSGHSDFSTFEGYLRFTDDHRSDGLDSKRPAKTLPKLK